MPQTTLNIPMDAAVKKPFEAFCADAGMDPTVAVNTFARAVPRGRIPCKVTGNDDPFSGQKKIRPGSESLCRDLRRENGP
jgi:DNA-damage-inducible protein J